jgi:hypothetical protein
VTQEPQSPYPEEQSAPTAWGSHVGQQPPPAVPAVPVYYGYPPHQPPAVSGMYVAAAVINWVVLALLVLGTCGVGLVAAAWFIPMTIYIHRGARDGCKHTGLGVCTLLFCNIISGILMLVEDGNREHRPAA